jgi:hypothetical protein
VTYNFQNSTATYLRALDAEGGWLQWSYKLSSILSANAAIGQDSASGNELRNSVPLSIIVSPEYRRLQSWPILGGVNTANIYTLTFGYQF